MNDLTISRHIELSPLKRSRTKEALAILAVDNIIVDQVGIEILTKVESGRMSYEQAVELILQQAHHLSLKHAG